MNRRVSGQWSVLVGVAVVMRPALVRKSVAEANVSARSEETCRIGCDVNCPPLGALPVALCEAAGAGLVNSLIKCSVVLKPHCNESSGNNAGSVGCLDRFGLIDCRFARWDNR